jgi:hypothetical protein
LQIEGVCGSAGGSYLSALNWQNAQAMIQKVTNPVNGVIVNGVIVIVVAVAAA